MHQKMKFSSPHGVGEVPGNQPASQICYINCLTRKNKRKILTIDTEVDPREGNPRPSPVEDLVKVKVDNSDNKVRIEAILSIEQIDSMILLLEEFKDIKPGNISNINTNNISHEFKDDLTIKMITQKKKVLGEKISRKATY